jgi:pyrroline-5-carboxylate reductase
MPNTPALVGAAMSALCPNDKVTPEEVKLVESLFNSFGRAEVVPESMMDAVVGVSGSSPAYVYMFIEAMADAAVADGMPRAQAYKFAAQSVLGAAKMVLETGKHPGELKDAVCSPGGTTIEAVAALEHGGFRDTVISAQRACSKKSYDMSQK